MALPSPWRRPWQATIESASKFSFVSSFPSSINSSIIFPVGMIQKKRIRTASSCLNSFTPRSVSPDDSSNRLTKMVNPVESVSTNQSGSRKTFALKFKSLFGKRALWRRMLFVSKKVRSIILLNVITIIYASDIPVLKEVEAVVDPQTFAAVRFSVSAIPFIPFVLQSRGDAHTRNAGIELGFWVGLGYLMQAFGMLTSDAGRASFLSMFTVIVVPLLDGMLGAKVPARTWFGALMSMLGVAMLESSGALPSIGDLFNFLSAVFFGVHMVRTERISRNTSKENFLPILAYEVCMVAVLSILWYFVGGWFSGNQEFNPSSWTWVMFWDWMVGFPWIPAIYTGILSMGLCLWIEMAAMHDVSATETAIIYGLEPVWGAGFAWFLLGERWGESGWIGAALVLGGSLTVQIFGLTSSPSPRKGGQAFDEGSDLLISGKANSFSASPIVVRSRKDTSDLLKK